MRTKTIAATAVVLSACAASAVPASATKIPNSREAWFSVSVKGVQTTKWAVDHKSEGRLCEYSEKGSGSERVVFHTRPVKMRAFQTLGIGPVYLLGRKGVLALRGRGTVTRHGSDQRFDFDPSCQVGDGGGPVGPPPKPDCGTRRIAKLPLTVEYDALKPKRITLHQDGTASPDFDRCPRHGEGWPGLIAYDQMGRKIGEELPPADLFDKRQGKMLVIGRGAVHHADPVADEISTTRIEWTITLRRLRR